MKHCSEFYNRVEQFPRIATLKKLCKKCCIPTFVSASKGIHEEVISKQIQSSFFPLSSDLFRLSISIYLKMKANGNATSCLVVVVDAVAVVAVVHFFCAIVIGKTLLTFD